MATPVKYGELRRCYEQWADFTPTLTWTTGTPAAITTVARWCQIGFNVFVNISITSADSNGCSDLTIANLPKACSATNAPLYSSEQYGAGGSTYTDPLAIINTAAPTTIQFVRFQTATDGQAIGICIAGFYEVAS